MKQRLLGLLFAAMFAVVSVPTIAFACGGDKKTESLCGGDKKTDSCGGDKKTESLCGGDKKTDSCGGDKKTESVI